MADLRERLLYPRAGWLSLGLLAVMALAVSWSVQGAGWLEQMDFLVPVALWAVLAGALLGMLGSSIVWTLPLGAIIGTVIVLWTVGGEYFTGLGHLERLVALRTDAIEWLIVVVRTGYPAQMSPYAIGLGALMFATVFIAAYAVYRHHRVLDAILLLGAAIITNMSATFTDLFGHLLLFVAAALLLWLRAALVDRQEGWQRRRVNENLDVPAAIMRSGIVFAGASVALAWILTSVAVAAPLTDAWRSFDGVWTGVRDQMEGVFGNLSNPQSRISGNSFGPSFNVHGEWISRDDEALVLAASRPLYLRTTTYDRYTGRGWERSDPVRRPVAPGADLFGVATSERPTVAAAVEVERIVIEMRQTIGRNLFTAGSPLRVYAPTVVLEASGRPVLGGIEHANPLGSGEAYELSVAIPTATEAELSAAGDAYPPEVTELYLETPGMTDRVAALAREVTASATNNYERAKALANFLSRDPSFSYATVAAVPEGGQDLVDFFLFHPSAERSGYCQYYATAMVVMARSLGLPARVAAGFAPGERQEDGTFLVREANAHAWAEVYFPGYGWQIFEATKSINPQFFRPTGDPGTAVPAPLQGIDPLLDEEILLQRGAGININALPSPNLVDGAIDPDRPELGAEGAASSARSGNALVIGALLIGAAFVVWLRMRQMQRRWRLLPVGDRAWRQLTAAADRAGVGPGPSETIYEYAGWLEEQLPRHGEPIRTVADGKVWQAYSGRRMTATAVQRLEAALASLRLPLVGLAIRRWLRRLVQRDAKP
ncbi:MAG TPA: transglutaminaseTgpA domain-containing protein [Candidatus Binatia bacterium]|nr:transglutaminaseTgpA domain-containing protein [Candidatus Binatia bacterium]